MKWIFIPKYLCAINVVVVVCCCYSWFVVVVVVKIYLSNAWNEKYILVWKPICKVISKILIRQNEMSQTYNCGKNLAKWIFSY